MLYILTLIESINIVCMYYGLNNHSYLNIVNIFLIESDIRSILSHCILIDTSHQMNLKKSTFSC